jgi:DNA (cytosine-5)-methyltransferase 1
MTLTVGSLFSGIGGLDLGLERAGMRVVWQSEIDPYACRVLARRWPDVPNLGDITTVDWSTVEPVDVICGGFPCQDISIAGSGAGLEGEHSGLWAHFTAAIRHLRPGYVVVENSPALPVRGLGQVLADLADLGYDAEWDCVPAAAVGARHLRARTWLVAYPAGERDGVEAEAVQPGWPSPVYDDWWATEPDVGRVAHGIPARVDRLRCLGNAVVPQVAEYVGQRIVEAAA